MTAIADKTFPHWGAAYQALLACRICGNSDLQSVFSLGFQALANDFVKPGEPRQGHYPLRVLFCEKCSLSQLSVAVDPNILYRNYKYVTSTSRTMQNHFDFLITAFKEENAFGGSVVEIGSNDGALLRSLSPMTSHPVIGIDPAENLVASNAICGLFNPGTAAEALEILGDKPSLIIARHCVAHMDDLHEFVDGLKKLAGTGTLIAIEIPYMRDTLKQVEFDQIYHEHLSFISLHSLQHLLADTSFHIHRVIHYPIHGGTVLVMLRHNESGVESTVSEYVREDKTTLENWRTFNIRATGKIEAMRQEVEARVGEGKTVCGFGASAKASVWIQACGFTEKELRYVTDNSPLKPGCLISGSDIPVVPQDQLKADYAVMFCWNFKEAALAATEEWRKGSGRFIIPTATGVEII